MLGNWQILKTETYHVTGWFYMMGNWQILITETYQVVEWFYAGQLADSENRNISGG